MSWRLRSRITDLPPGMPSQNETREASKKLDNELVRSPASTLLTRVERKKSRQRGRPPHEVQEPGMVLAHPIDRVKEDL